MQTCAYDDIKRMPPTALHGVPLSQPFRAVAWACLQKRLPFEVKMVVPGSTRAPHGSRSDDFLKLNPAGTVPLLQDDLVTLAESPAILTSKTSSAPSPLAR